MLKALFSRPYSHLFIVGDNAGWAVDVDAQELKRMARKLNIPAHVIRRMYFNLPQAVHYTSQFSLMLDIYHPKNRISVDYYHGKPGENENERLSFTRCFEALQRNHEQLTRVRVSTREMETLIKSSGIDPAKVMRIPIGIDTKIFYPQTPENRRIAREMLEIPDDAMVIGSFQKDGNGKGDGNDPKLIKGPDIFINVVERLKQDIPNLWVLLSGPARGYVKNELDKIGVPYKHHFLKEAGELTNFYDAIDLYIVTSREEGGPKSVLESMAKGVPLVTTAVGQAKDLVISGENAMMSAVEDDLGLTEQAVRIINDPSLKERLARKGLETAEENSFESQLPLWQEYLKPLIK